MRVYLTGSGCGCGWVWNPRTTQLGITTGEFGLLTAMFGVTKLLSNVPCAHAAERCAESVRSGRGRELAD